MSANRAPLRIGSLAPDFQAETTEGTIKFYEFVENKWAILLSHPYKNPVSTTELSYFEFMKSEFTARGVEIIALAPGTVEAHKQWREEINRLSKEKLTIPIIADQNRKVAFLYDMLEKAHAVEGEAHQVPPTIRDIFIIDPKKTVRLIFSYPVSVGGNVQEVLRVVDCLKTGDESDVMTPANWEPGDSVIVPPERSTASAEEAFSEVNTLSQHLRLAALSVEDTSVPSVDPGEPIKTGA